MRVGLFPGQGIPAKMAFEALPESDPLVETANEILGYDLRQKVGISSRRAKSTLPTSLAQPAIFTAGVLAWRAAEAEGEKFDWLAGHSLGEYTALVAGGAMSFEDGLEAVSVRGEAMNDAARVTPGGMVAVLGLAFDAAQDIADRAGVVLANDNAPGQVVLSGNEDALAEAAALVRGQGGRAVLLEVSGPFHTPGLEPAVPALTEVLESIDIRTPEIPVISNVTARPHDKPDEIRSHLVEQMLARVRFRESLQYVWQQGVREYRDLGPGQVAAGLAKKTFNELETRAVDGGSDRDITLDEKKEAASA
ncbi:MAG TPA: ACP S-malonyltransferase [Actinomycetota bacterium]|nr:ACP S-malonyltransferase [Actinomycetota bacterium]